MPWLLPLYFYWIPFSFSNLLTRSLLVTDTPSATFPKTKGSESVMSEWVSPTAAGSLEGNLTKSRKLRVFCFRMK